ncbi:MAG: type II secretion system protein GspG [Phycisphaerales bacterium]|nr:type II secretion system protein GspG [Phycisphaerales bacterium]
MAKRTNRKRRKGFTLLEVLLVCGILAVLAAVVLPNLMKMGDQAKNDLARSEVERNGNIAKALERFNFECGRYPEKIEDLYRKPSYIEDESDGKTRWNGPYMDGDPSELKDPWGNQFNYNGEGQYNEGKYDLWSSGKNGKDERGGGDDIKNWRDK